MVRLNDESITKVCKCRFAEDEDENLFAYIPEFYLSILCDTFQSLRR